MDEPKRIEFLARGLWICGSKVLVCRNLKHGYCYLPGGHVEPGESAKRALEREFLEEADERIRVGEACLVVEQRFVQRGKARHEISLVFHVERHGDANEPVHSQEPDISFELVESDHLGQRDFLPSFSIDTVRALVSQLGTGSGTRPAPTAIRAAPWFLSGP